MTVEIRIAVIALAAFAATGVAIGLAVPMAAARWPRGTASDRARWLAFLRLLPPGTALAAGTLVVAAFAAFEPRWDGERLGVIVPVAALLGATFIGAATWRGVKLALATRRLTARLLPAAEPVALPGFEAPAFAVESDFPIVAVVGLWRPRLIIARSVLESCTPSELRAVLAHEQGHIDRADNLRRLLLLVAPDALACFPVSERMLAAWRDAAEDAADDDAWRAGADGRTLLAAALLKVARLAPASTAHALMPASTLYRGDGLERRVRRLLEPGEAGPAPRASRPWMLRVALAAAAGASFVLLERVHGVFEQLIQVLP